MSNDSFLLTCNPEGIVHLSLARPDRRNAFDNTLIAELTNALLELQADASIRALILTGEGKAFSAGADLNWMKAMADYSHAENLADSLRLGQLMHTLYGLPFPTIARINGPALGGGVGLIACCDIAISTQEAFFALSEARLGLIPAVISPFVIDAIGPRHAARYFQTAERFDATTAKQIGLVHEIVTRDKLNEKIEEILCQILANGPQAVRASKALVRDFAHRPIDDAVLKLSAARIADIRTSPEGQEGLQAFLQKRKPDWSNQ